jgi:hypothetical protein
MAPPGPPGPAGGALCPQAVSNTTAPSVNVADSRCTLRATGVGRMGARANPKEVNGMVSFSGKCDALQKGNKKTFWLSKIIHTIVNVNSRPSKIQHF